MKQTIPLPTDKSQIESYTQRVTCMELLEQDLTPSDSHDEQGAMMTSNKEWYFVPCEGDFVMTERTLRSNTPVPSNRLKWRLEAVVTEHNYPSEPDWSELVEVGKERYNSLLHAIEGASILNHSNKIRNIGEGIYWSIENLKEKLGYYEGY
jgi:hypothetical protein